MSSTDRGYINLLSALRQPNPPLPLETILAAICHYLLHSSNPTPLAASIVASPIWSRPSHKTAIALGSAFRSAVILRFEASKKERGALFSGGGQNAQLDSWVRFVLDGLEGGNVILRLAISGGMLLGIVEQKGSEKSRTRIESCFLIGVAEILDVYTSVKSFDSSWEAEFQPRRAVTDDLRLGILLSSQYYSSVSEVSLSALDLSITAKCCMSLIKEAFGGGELLFGADASLSSGKADSISIEAGSPLESKIQNLYSSETFVNIALLSKMVAKSISVLVDNVSSVRRTRAWDLLVDVHGDIADVTSTIERDWQNSRLANVSDEKDIHPNSAEVTTKLWTILKTLLFSIVMIQQAISSSMLYLPPTRSSWTSDSPRTLPTAPEVSASMLKALASLAFVIAQFGGVLAGAGSEGNEKGFPQLRKVFYTSLDILSSDSRESEQLVSFLANSVENRPMNPFFNARRAYCLSCIEQLIPSLGDECIKSDVLSICQPLLYTPSHRETYESAHSVMLAIFAADAKKTIGSQTKEKEKPSLAEILVPGYVECLLNNVRGGNLTTLQFRLAYSALVRSASSGRTLVHTGRSLDKAENQNLAWLCVAELLRALESTRPTSRGKEPDGRTEERRRLQLTLISLTPNVALELLPRVLAEVDRTIDTEKDEEQRRILIQALFDEILDRVGDGAKEFAIRWWYGRYGGEVEEKRATDVAV